MKRLAYTYADARTMDLSALRPMVAIMDGDQVDSIVMDQSDAIGDADYEGALARAKQMTGLLDQQEQTAPEGTPVYSSFDPTADAPVCEACGDLKPTDLMEVVENPHVYGPKDTMQMRLCRECARDIGEVGGFDTSTKYPLSDVEEWEGTDTGVRTSSLDQAIAGIARGLRA